MVPWIPGAFFCLRRVAALDESSSLARGKESPGPAMKWFLKKPDGTIFGPSEESVLEVWAADGRVAPEDQVSSDAQHWRPAPELPALNMEWVVELEGGGRYGPLHAQAFRGLVQSGDLVAATPVRSVKTGQRGTVSGVLLPYLLAIESALQEKIDRLNARLEEDRTRAEAALKAAQEETARLRTEAALAVARAEEAQKQAEEKNGEIACLAAELKSAREQAEKKEQEAAQAAAEARAAQDVALKAQQEAEKASARAKQAEQQVREWQQKAARAAADWKTSQGQIAELQGQLEKQLKQAGAGEDLVKKQAAELASATAQLATARTEGEKWKQLYEHLRTIVEAEKARAAEQSKKPANPNLVPRERLEEAERKIAHLERNYRQAVQALHRNVRARSSESPVPPPEHLHRRDIV